MEWTQRRAAILAKYTTNEALAVQASFLALNVPQQGGGLDRVPTC